MKNKPTSNRSELQVSIQNESRRLTSAEFQGLTEVPPEVEWFANIINPRTRRAYQLDMRDFMSFVGLGQIEEFRSITRAHVLASVAVK